MRLPVAATEASVAKIGEILDAMPDCTPLQALRANERLADLLTDRRAGVVEAALEQEASWADIGKAMGMTEERARDWYRTVTDPGYVSDHQDAFIERVFRQDHDDD
jgi:hypothetical protein